MPRVVLGATASLQCRKAGGVRHCKDAVGPGAGGGHWDGWVGRRNDSFGQENAPFGCRDGHFGRQSEPFGHQTESFGRQNAAFWRQNRLFGHQNEPFGHQNEPFGRENAAFGRLNGSFGCLNGPSGRLCGRGGCGGRGDDNVVGALWLCWRGCCYRALRGRSDFAGRAGGAGGGSGRCVCGAARPGDGTLGGVRPNGGVGTRPRPATTECTCLAISFRAASPSSSGGRRTSPPGSRPTRRDGGAGERLRRPQRRLRRRSRPDEQQGHELAVEHHLQKRQKEGDDRRGEVPGKNCSSGPRHHGHDAGGSELVGARRRADPFAPHLRRPP